MRVSVTRGEAVLISGLDDVLIGSYPANGKLGTELVWGADAQCVFSSTGAFGLEVSSRNAATVGGSSPSALPAARPSTARTSPTASTSSSPPGCRTATSTAPGPASTRTSRR